MLVIGFSWPSTVPCWRARYSSSKATSTASAPIAAAFMRNCGDGGKRIRRPSRSAGVRIGTFAVNWRAPVFQRAEDVDAGLLLEALLQGV